MDDGVGDEYLISDPDGDTGDTGDVDAARAFSVCIALVRVFG